MVPRTVHPTPFVAAFAAAIALLSAACADPDPPALSVGPIEYSENDLLGLSPSRRAMLGHLTAFGLAVADSGLSALGRPLTEERVDDRVLEILAAERVLEERGIDDAVLEAHYRTDPDTELTVRHILFFSERWRAEAHRSEARRKAERALSDLRSGADFAETAARRSEEPGAVGRQGLLQPGREGSWVDEFWTAAQALEVGEVSPVTETEYGYHILRLEKRDTVPFADSRSRVARSVAARAGDPSVWLDRWRDPAAREEALADADGRGLSARDEEVEEIERRWTSQAERWAAALGFHPGMGIDRVREAARTALARTGQAATIARSELEQHVDLLEARYGIEIAGPGV